MSVLGIDTAGPVVGIAYFDQREQYAWTRRVTKGADIHLMKQCTQVLNRYSPSAISVSVGPGSFVSLRVGVSIALGLAESLRIPVVPVSSLQARACCFPSSRCLALLDARKGRVYGQLFDSSAEIPIALSTVVDQHLNEILPDGEFIAGGEGAVRYKEEILSSGGFVPRDAARSPALEVAKLGALMEDTACDPIEVALQYLRPADINPAKNLGIPMGVPQRSVGERK